MNSVESPYESNTISAVVSMSDKKTTTITPKNHRD